jgi:hypothetical protein
MVLIFSEEVHSLPPGLQPTIFGSQDVRQFARNRRALNAAETTGNPRFFLSSRRAQVVDWHLLPSEPGWVAPVSSTG